MQVILSTNVLDLLLNPENKSSTSSNREAVVAFDVLAGFAVGNGLFEVDGSASETGSVGESASTRLGIGLKNEMKWCGFKPPLCRLLRLNWAWNSLEKQIIQVIN